MSDSLPIGTLRARLAIWNTLVVLTAVVTALLAARFAARATLYDAADRELRSGVREVVLALRDLFPDTEAVVAELRRKAASHEERGWFTQLLEEDGRQIWKSEHCPDQVANFPPHNLDRTENIVQVGPYRYVRLRIAEPNQPVFHVRVGTYTTGLDASLSGLVRLLSVVGLLLCAITPVAGWWLAVRSTRPVAALLETADRLDPTRLGDRLPVRGIGDELDHLAATINRLLDDVAAHVERQRQFVADAAHELRGPLAAIHSAVEVSLSHDRTPVEYRDTLEELLEEVRYLSKLSNGLLMLAETGARAVPTNTAPVELASLAQRAAAMFGGVAEERGVDIHVSTTTDSAVVPGDAGQLRQLLGNLLDNAIRFTPAGGTVEVQVAPEPGRGRMILTVADSGPGIAAEHLPRLFDRFYKVDPSRSRGVQPRSGGLGLPICRAIVERHGGTIAISNRDGGGTAVTVFLPTASSSARPTFTERSNLAAGASS